MKGKKLDGVQVWKDFENEATRRNLNLIERAVYWLLLLHTRLEGKARERFTIAELACKLKLSRGPIRNAMRRLADHGSLRFIERSYNGHLVEVRLPPQVHLPAEVRAAHRKMGTSARTKPRAENNLERVDFLRSTELRQAIHAREGGQCFYCRRRTPGGRSLCLDHVVPCARSGENSYRNLVSCCAECNWQKKDHGAEDFLRELYREGRLSRKELSGGLRKLRALVAGELRPRLRLGRKQ
ncbi:MAG TPA: HNH endonuclease [Candidatus Acidoferrum sp.]|nr:HNH endonuclease [Candidatus Acidoferrum sp.]